MGTPFMPWQQQVADVAGEIDPETGLLAYREVWVLVMRQSGKTTWELSTETERCVSWDTPQRVVYTAQNGWEAKTKLLEDQVPILQASPLGKLITPAGGGRVRRAQGDWGINFGSGSRIDVLGSSGSAGHGRTVDLGVIDEAWKDEDDRREQALLPAMITRPWAQLIGASTMGTDASVYLNRKVDAGRHWAVEDPGAGVAYFEFSIPEDADIDDPEVWWTYMPALGYTITEEAVAHARQTMEDGEFRRAFGNQRTAGGGERIIPPELWDRVVAPTAAPEHNLTFGLDINHDRSSAAICVSDGETIEMVDHLPGTGWLVERASQLVEAWGGEVVLDGGGPAVSVADELEELRVKVRRLQGGEIAAACGRIYDAIADGKVKVRPSQSLDEAVAGVAKRPTGDRFVWSRSTSLADVTPLVAATMAYSHGGEGKAKPFVLLD